MTSQIKNIVFSGGGVKGIAYAGVVRALADKQMYYKLDGFAGSSVGSIAALLCSLRAKPKDIEQLIGNMDLNNFCDDSRGYLRDIYRIFKRFGFYKGENLYKWFGYLCRRYAKSENVTFWDIFSTYESELKIVAVDMNSSLLHIFDRHNSPLLPVREAIRASVAIPLFFTAHKMGLYKVYVDGALISNYPMFVFDEYEGGQRIPNPYTIGCRFLASKQYPRTNDDINLRQYLSTLSYIIMNQIGHQHEKQIDWDRSILIDTGGIAPTDFYINPDKRKFLIKSGYDATIKFLGERDEPNSNM